MGEDMKPMLYTAAAVALVAAQAAIAADVRIKDVTVEADLSAVANQQAAAYWQNIGPDLETAIAARLGPMASEEGSEIKIDIDEVSLANSFQTQLGIADSVLAGDVAVTSNNAIDEAQNYELKVSIETANAFLPEGSVVATGFTDTPEYYAALINAFADSVVRRLE
jgi:hypothetical protein